MYIITIILLIRSPWAPVLIIIYWRYWGPTIALKCKLNSCKPFILSSDSTLKTYDREINIFLHVSISENISHTICTRFINECGSTTCAKSRPQTIIFCSRRKFTCISHYKLTILFWISYKRHVSCCLRPKSWLNSEENSRENYHRDRPRPDVSQMRFRVKIDIYIYHCYVVNTK